jgi:hypothetical protein
MGNSSAFVSAAALICCTLLISGQSAGAFSFGKVPTESAGDALNWASVALVADDNSLPESVRYHINPNHADCLPGAVISNTLANCEPTTKFHPARRLWALPNQEDKCIVGAHPYAGNSYQDYSEVLLVDLEVESDGLYKCPLPILCNLKCVPLRYECEDGSSSLPCHCGPVNNYRFSAAGHARRESFSAAQWTKCN